MSPISSTFNLQFKWEVLEVVQKNMSTVSYVIVIVIVSYMSSFWELLTFNLQFKWEVLEDVQESAFEAETANLVEYDNKI